MTNRIIERTVQLYAYGFLSNEDMEKAVAKLHELSGLKVCIGWSHRSIFAYFDDIVKAQAAALDVECLVYCKTEVRKGTFNVTSLVI